MVLALALLVAPLAVPPAHTQSAERIARTVVGETHTLEATRVTYAPGAVEPAGPHVFDLVLVPIENGLSVEIEGKPAAWTPGVPIIISRGAPHRIANTTSAPVTFISVRIANDAVAFAESPHNGEPSRVTMTSVTLVRAIDNKYVRVRTFRLERGGVMQAPSGDLDDSLIVVPAAADLGREIAGDTREGVVPAGSAFLVPAGGRFSFRNRANEPIEVIRITVVAR